MLVPVFERYTHSVVDSWTSVSGNVMLSLRAVATTEGSTSLHSPVFVVGVTAVVVAAGDEHDVAKRATPAAATRHRLKQGGRTGGTLHTRVGEPVSGRKGVQAYEKRPFI